VNLPLQQPELYDIEQDPTEAYDAAPENPAVVAEITGRIDRLIEGFPEEVKQAWSQTRARQTASRPVGALPAPASQK
jgi:hypothetical protein